MAQFEGVLTIPMFLAWAKTQPTSEKYDHSNPYGCPIHTFLRREGGVRCPLVVLTDYFKTEEVSGDAYVQYPIPSALNSALSNEEQHRTYGALVERLEAIVA